MPSPIRITGTHIAYLHLCHSKLWLFAHGLQMEHTSDLVAEGKLVDEYSYPQRAERYQQIEIDGVKIDHYDAQRGIIREVKKSKKRAYAHTAQVQYYIYVLRAHGIYVDHGILEYPRLRETDQVFLNECSYGEIQSWVEQVHSVIDDVNCPVLIKTSLCKRCAYRDFCYS